MLPLQWAQLTKTVYTARLGLEFDFLCFFRLHDLSLCSCMFCFTLVSWVISHSCFGTGITNLNEPPSSFLLPPHYCGLGAGSIPFRAIANNKQCEMRGLFMSPVIHYWMEDVQDCQGVSASEMTYIVSSGALNSTHSPILNTLFLLTILINACCTVRLKHRQTAISAG